MTMKTRHWAIIAVAAVTVAAFFNNIPLESLTGFYAFMAVVIGGDKAISMKNGDSSRPVGTP